MHEDREKEIYKKIDDYFKTVDPGVRRPSPWRVPIGGSVYDEHEVKAVLECYFRGWLSVQKKVQEFEKLFSDYIGVRHGVAVNSGTSANILALATFLETGDLKKGDEVIVPATTFVSVASPIIQLGLVPVYVDVDQETFNIDPQEFKNAIDPKKTKAVIVVHTLGCPADMDPIMETAQYHGLKVIEDCCEAHGAMYHGKKVGSFGDLATFSFYVAHHITTGEGGMVLTNSDEYYQILAELREFGRLKSYQGPRYGYSDEHLKDFDERYVFHRIGYNFRMADPPAAFGIEQFKKLDDFNKKRITYARWYIDEFKNNFLDFFGLPSLRDPDIVHIPYTFPILLKTGAGKSRSEVARYLESQGIETRAIFCGTLPDHPCFVEAPGRIQGELAVSRNIRDNAFFVGCHPGLSQDDLEYVAKTLKELFQQ